jgi:hypothetical protein
MTPCTYRGEIWRHVTSKLCGSRGAQVPVYRCTRHVICCETKYQHGQSERVCLTCPDYERRASDDPKAAAPS